MSHALTVMQEPVSQETIKLINAPVNYDLIKNNKYDKFGDGDYVSTETITDLLNAIFNFQWSWEIIDFIDKGDFVICHGRLTVPGIGIKDGIGSAKADKKDNSTMYSSANSFALKNAAKKIGIAPNVLNKENWNLNVSIFEPGSVDTAPANNQQTPAPAQEKPVSQTQKQVPSTAKEMGAELRDAYGITTKAQFVAFAQIWNPEIQVFEDINGETIEKLHAYVEANPEEFEDFKAEDY